MNTLVMKRVSFAGAIAASLLAMNGLCLRTGAAAEAAAPAPIDAPGSPLSTLALRRSGQAMHEGSWDRGHQNNDFRPIQPGETLTLFEHRGAATVHRFWVTVNPRQDVEVLSQLILRMYWDDDKYPSVECPLGAFFGVGFGEQKDYISLPLNETSGGYNSYWPMPFHKSARWTVTNTSAKSVKSFYYNIDYTATKSLPANALHFHAQFRRENPTTPGKNYTILETAGAGHYVGTALFMSGRGLPFLEGNEMVYIDGSATPNIEGTGTEDYFSSGWYFDRGTYSAPYHGVIIKEERPARISAYRWHIEDAIPFTRSIRFTIEHGAQNSSRADYSSVAYYYLTGPSPAPAALPADLLPSHLALPTPMKIPGAIEAESLQETAKATSGDLNSFYMDDIDPQGSWSDGKVLFWSPTEDDKNPELILPVPTGAGGKSQVTIRVVTGPYFGTVQFVFDGKPVGETVDLFSDKWEPRDISLGSLMLQPGSSHITVRAVGKNVKAKGNGVGTDALTLKP
jgi:D-arabinan exo alpha-(1,3)/(1,5)-arabinofuranosidase (non-reducing end)